MLKYVYDSKDTIVEYFSILIIDVLIVQHILRLPVLLLLISILVVFWLIQRKVIHVAQLVVLQVRIINKVWVTIAHLDFFLGVCHSFAASHTLYLLPFLENSVLLFLVVLRVRLDALENLLEGPDLFHVEFVVLLQVTVVALFKMLEHMAAVRLVLPSRMLDIADFDHSLL